MADDTNKPKRLAAALGLQWLSLEASERRSWAP